MLEHLIQSDFVRTRAGERKLGEDFVWLDRNWKSRLEDPFIKYVLLGVKEDFGPRANLGKPGAKDFFPAFLNAATNFQSNQFLTGKNVAVLGLIDFTKHYKPGKGETISVNELRSTVAKMDENLWPILREIYKQNKVPILVGGGHNNALPLIKAAALAFNRGIQVLNVDAHADFRNTNEGRHSGNSFSTAWEAGFLEHYAVLGLHKNYNSQSLLDKMSESKVKQLFLEDIPANQEIGFCQQWIALQLHSQKRLGLEIDLDGIENTRSSAQSPYGFKLNSVRNITRFIAGDKRICYFNLTEGVNDENNQCAKSAAYLFGDFING